MYRRRCCLPSTRYSFLGLEVGEVGQSFGHRLSSWLGSGLEIVGFGYLASRCVIALRDHPALLVPIVGCGSTAALCRPALAQVLKPPCGRFVERKPLVQEDGCAAKNGKIVIPQHC